MKVLVLGGSGATGRLVVRQLIKRNIDVRLVVRESSLIEKQTSENKSIELIRTNINDLDIQQATDLVKGCDSVISCLGHNVSVKGIFGSPRKLVYNTVAKVTEALKSQNRKSKFILMSTTAYTNNESGEVNTPGEKLVFSLLYLVLPPHRDNMLAANHLIYKTTPDTGIEWVAVRPDSLFDEAIESDYTLHNNKTRSPIFNPGRTSRVNVSHFMAELLTDETLWNEWKYKTPVIYNRDNE